MSDSESGDKNPNDSSTGEDHWLQPGEELRIVTDRLEELVRDVQLYFSSLNFDYDQRTTQRPDV